MRLRKVLTTASLVFAGVSSARAELLMCQSCPAGTWSDGTLRECKNCLTTGVASCDPSTGKATSCKPGYGYSNGSCSACADREYSSGTEACKAVTKQTGTLQNLFGANIASGILKAHQAYILNLGGGNGGNNNKLSHHFSSSTCSSSGLIYTCTATGGFSGGSGARASYLIIPKRDLSYTLAVGANGEDSDEAYAAAGGGGGSWFYLSSGMVIIAGGGGGAPSMYPNRSMGSQGGNGGAMGAGGGSGDWYGKAAGRDGGASGNLAGGRYGTGNNDGGNGAGHSYCGRYCGGLGGSMDREAKYTPIFSNNTFGGTGGWSTESSIRSGEIKRTFSCDLGSSCPNSSRFPSISYYYYYPKNGSAGIVPSTSATSHYSSYSNNDVSVYRLSNESYKPATCGSCVQLFSAE